MDKTFDTYKMTETEKAFFSLISDIGDKNMDKESSDAMLELLTQISMKLDITNELLQKLGRISPS